MPSDSVRPQAEAGAGSRSVPYVTEGMARPCYRWQSMKAFHTPMTVLAAVALGGVWVTQAQGAPPVVIETVTVGNPGNTGDTQIQGIFGAVDYAYAMGKHEVTAGQYTEFLNAVAVTETYGLYHTRMDFDADPGRNGCNIKRQGAPCSYTYSVAPDRADRPVNYVSWGDAARFANWLHNGQPTGAQEFDETVPEPDIRGIRGGSWFWDGLLGAWERPLDMHSSDQFNHLGFRVATLGDTSQAVPALSERGFPALLLWVAFVGTIVLRPRRRASAD